MTSIQFVSISKKSTSLPLLIQFIYKSFNIINMRINKRTEAVKQFFVSQLTTYVTKYLQMSKSKYKCSLRREQERQTTSCSFTSIFEVFETDQLIPYQEFG